MILRYLGTHFDDFWCYGVVDEIGNREVDKWRKETARCLQTIGPEIWVAWGKLKQIQTGTIHVKRGQHNNRFHHKLRSKSRMYNSGEQLDYLVPDIVRIMNEEVLVRTLKDGPTKRYYDSFPLEIF